MAQKEGTNGGAWCCYSCFPESQGGGEEGDPIEDAEQTQRKGGCELEREEQGEGSFMNWKEGERAHLKGLNPVRATKRARY